MHDGMAGSMTQLPAMDLIVGLAALFAVLFVAAWLFSPRLRAWVERPKYRFQANVRSYDETQGATSVPEPRSPR
jgi:membrane protein implicated in regulation of membrane protease activity